jgi:hypothetical protein
MKRRKRRNFIMPLGGAAAWPFAASAQHAGAISEAYATKLDTSRPRIIGLL